MQTYVDAIKPMVQWFPVILLFNHTMTNEAHGHALAVTKSTLQSPGG